MCLALRKNRVSHCDFWPPSTGRSGAVLLEVVLALVLFVGAAAVLSGGLSSSLDSVERLRANTHAADLAVTVMSELQMGVKTWTLSGPQPFEPPIDGWTWEVSVAPQAPGEDEASPLRQVEVIIRHAPSGLIYRMTQSLRTEEGSAAPLSKESPTR